MFKFTSDSIELISSATISFIDFHLKEALKSGNNKSKINLKQVLPAKIVAYRIIKKYDLVNLQSDFLVDVEFNLTRNGKNVAEMGIINFLNEKNDSVRNFVKLFVREEMNKQKTISTETH